MALTDFAITSAGRKNACVAALTLFVSSGLAFAIPTVSDPFMRIQASSGLGSGQIQIGLNDNTGFDDDGDNILDPVVQTFSDPDNNFWLWRSSVAQPITNNVGDQIATLVSMFVLAYRSTQVDTGEVRFGVDVNYVVIAGSQDTTFELTSPTLFFDPIFNASGSASGTWGGSDSDGNGLLSTPGLSSGHVYETLLNGSTPFISYFDQNLVAGASGSNGFAGNTVPVDSFQPTGLTVSSVSSHIRFTVSSNDQTSGTSTFAVVPAPGTAALLALSGLLAGRRRRA